MPTETDQIQPLDVRTLLDLHDNYEIPIYQRNYAWEAVYYGDVDHPISGQIDPGVS